MDEASALIGVAEIGVAVAGFSGVATALGRGLDEDFWTAARRAFFQDLLIHSGIAIFASLVPLVVLHGAIPEAEVWLVSSLLWAFFASFGITGGYLRGRRLRSETDAEHYTGRIVTPLVLSGFLLLWLLQLYNAFALRAFWPYLAALAGNLGFAFVQFMRLVVPGAKPGGNGADGASPEAD